MRKEINNFLLEVQKNGIAKIAKINGIEKDSPMQLPCYIETLWKSISPYLKILWHLRLIYQ